MLEKLPRNLRRAVRTLLCAAGLSAVAGSAVTTALAEPEDTGDTEPLRMLALGDSYTIGESVPEAERWPVQLAAALREKGLAVAPPEIIARTGWTTAQLASAIERARLRPPYDLVTLLIGVNDQFREYEEDAYPERFQALLDRALELAGGRKARVLVVSIPDYGVTPFGQRYGGARISRALDGYNRINRERAAQAGVRSIDITPISREATRDPALIADDGLHPSGTMYARWVEEILPAAERALRSSAPSGAPQP